MKTRCLPNVCSPCVNWTRPPSRSGSTHSRRAALRGVGDLFAVVQQRANRSVEPAIDGYAQQISRDDEEHDHWHERRGEPRGDEFCPESRPDDPALPLKHELHDAAQQHEDDADDEQDVDDPDEVTDLTIERELALQADEGIPVYVIPLRTPARTEALRKHLADRRRRPLGLPPLPSRSL